MKKIIILTILISSTLSAQVCKTPATANVKTRSMGIPTGTMDKFLTTLISTASSINYFKSKNAKAELTDPICDAVVGTMGRSNIAYQVAPDVLIGEFGSNFLDLCKDKIAANVQKSKLKLMLENFSNCPIKYSSGTNTLALEDGEYIRFFNNLKSNLENKFTKNVAFNLICMTMYKYVKNNEQELKNMPDKSLFTSPLTGKVIAYCSGLDRDKLIEINDVAKSIGINLPGLLEAIRNF